MTALPDMRACPFCGARVQLREALWPSEGDTDAIIHVNPTTCPLISFSNGSADGCVTVVEKWNSRKGDDRDELIEALRAQLDVSLQFMEREGFSVQEVANCTAQARAVLAKVGAALPDRFSVWTGEP